MVDTPRRSSRSKSPSTPVPQAETAPEVTTTPPNLTKSNDQLAEEREKRRERLLAGREARLSKIVSSVGGTNFTPPLADLPADLPKPKPKTGKVDTDHGEGVRARHVAPAIPTPPLPNPNPNPTVPGNGEQQAGAAASLFLSPDHRQTVLMLIINIGAIIYGWHWLGRDCFKQVFSTTAPLAGECQCKFAVARKAYLGLLFAAMVPIMAAMVRRGNAVMIPSTVVSMLCLWVAVLVIVGQVVERL